jgi:hypothetical protein
MSRSYVKDARKVVAMAERRAQKQRERGKLDAMHAPRKPSRVPIWLRFILARSAVSVLWSLSSVLSIAGVWWSRPGKDCLAWSIAGTLSNAGLRCFSWAVGEPRP